MANITMLPDASVTGVNTEKANNIMKFGGAK